ncbi:hypothetical protein GS966_28600 [Rhodococcus hoagii]|nr:hypothetical protein [Prescottella equi]NKS10248.1 hypothetical protein [Prescottella equi]NKS35239.1 hypothetical protein [Prescottella equi]NKS62086.1 hypothetical protein [Prescottella equi]NKS68244.1 hypothetical protein [Prescottella equi]
MTSTERIDDTATYASVRVAANESAIEGALTDLLATATTQARELAATKTNQENVVYTPVLQHIDHHVTERREGGYVVSVVAVTEFRPVFT